MQRTDPAVRQSARCIERDCAAGADPEYPVLGAHPQTPASFDDGPNVCVREGGDSVERGEAPVFQHGNAGARSDPEPSGLVHEED